MKWGERAKALFFIEKRTVKEVAEIVGRRYETVLKFLQVCEEYAEERELRKSQTAECRKDYKKQWDKSNRSVPEHLKITAQSLRREHFSAVAILSRERH